MLKGWKTILFGLFVTVVPAALTYIGGINWTSLGISPGVASMIGIAIMALRSVTNTPVGKG